MCHDSSVHQLVIDEATDTFVTGSGSGEVKVWSLSTLQQRISVESVHSHRMFRSGVLDLLYDGTTIYTCGVDGLVRSMQP